MGLYCVHLVLAGYERQLVPRLPIVWYSCMIVILFPWVWPGLEIAPQTMTISVQRFKQRKVWCSSVSPSLALSLALFDRNKTLSSGLPYRGSSVKELRDAFSLLATMGGSLEMVFSSVAFMWCQLQLTCWFLHWEWFWAQTPRKKVPRSLIHINS